VWFMVSDSYFFWAKVFHKMIFLSAPADKIYLLSGEKEQVKTSLVCPMNYLVVFPYLRSHNLKVLSQEDDTANPFS